jgi:hypothetical protein
MPALARSIVAATAILTACGCSAGSTVPAVSTHGDLAVRLTADPPQPAPVSTYAGPLVAAQALECDHATRRTSRVGYGEGLSVQGTALDAVAHYIEDEAAAGVPSAGYRLEQEAPGAALLSYDVSGRTKIAFVAVDGMKDVYGRTGWGVRTFAACDPAELPARITDALGVEIWQDRRGRRVPTTEVSSYTNGFCDAPDAGLLELHRQQAGRTKLQFVRDPSGIFREFLGGRYEASSSLPAEATDTGWHRGGKELWIGPQARAAYLVARGRVERWPVVTKKFGCG